MVTDILLVAKGHSDVLFRSSSLLADTICFAFFKLVHSYRVNSNVYNVLIHASQCGDEK